MKRKIMFPFFIGIDPMERLIVVDIKDDPKYLMIEPQVFDDPVNGCGMRILLYRKDNKVDVYWQPGVNADRETISIGAGIGAFRETTIHPSKFIINPTGVDLHVAFTDEQGRNIELKISEKSKRIRRMPFLAPVGKDIENPMRLFLPYMLEFDFVRKKGTEFDIKIGNQTRQPVAFPITRNFRKVWFMRYSALPVIGTFNSPATKPSVFEIEVPGTVKIHGMTINVNKQCRINRISAEYKKQNVAVDFPAGFPNLYDLTEGNDEDGIWHYYISGSLITGGNYSLSRKNNEIQITVDVTKCWRPQNLPLSFKLFTFLVRSFRNWPATYNWTGLVNVENRTLHGKWERKKK